MSRVYSSLDKWAVDLQDGGGMHIFTPQPDVMQIIRRKQTPVRLNGTDNVPKFWNLAIRFKNMRFSEMSDISAIWRPTKQKVLLNYSTTKNFSNPATGDATSGWITDEAVWATPPLVNSTASFRAIRTYDVTLLFKRLAWQGVVPTAAVAGGGGDLCGFYAGLDCTYAMAVDSVTSTSVTLSWSGSATGSDLLLYQGIHLIGTFASTSTGTTVTGLTGATPYIFYLLVRDTTTSIVTAQSNRVDTETS